MLFSPARHNIADNIMMFLKFCLNGEWLCLSLRAACLQTQSHDSLTGLELVPDNVAFHCCLIVSILVLKILLESKTLVIHDDGRQERLVFACTIATIWAILQCAVIMALKQVYRLFNRNKAVGDLETGPLTEEEEYLNRHLRYADPEVRVRSLLFQGLVRKRCEDLMGACYLRCRTAKTPEEAQAARLAYMAIWKHFSQLIDDITEETVLIARAQAADEAREYAASGTNLLNPDEQEECVACKPSDVNGRPKILRSYRIVFAQSFYSEDVDCGCRRE